MKILILLLIFIPTTALSMTTFPKDFFFGIATAPGHVEDQLDDIWKVWGEEGKTAGFKVTPLAAERLRFWSQPQVELDLAQEVGIQVYRLGVDWGRIMTSPNTFDQSVIEKYRWLLKEVKKRNMKVMLTLMHHSVPKWMQNEGGWMKDESKKYFINFAQKMIDEYQSDVDYWITFNEANVFAPLAYTAGMWPPGEKRSFTSMMAIGPFVGETVKAMDRMTEAHNEVYEWAHKKFPKIQMGIAHNMAYYTGKSFLNKIAAKYTYDLMNWRFPEKIKDHMDFFGFNYYGAEWLDGATISIDPTEEYSEAGRAVYPEGLYLILKEIHEKFPTLPIMITENGISDSTDILRKAYITEHLVATKKAMDEGVPVVGYIQWTLSDNMEWSDGYCPKFGLVNVLRDQNLKREKRPSFDYFKKIVTTKSITDDERDSSWKLVMDNVGKERPFCRAEDGVTALAQSKKRKFVQKDWRFNPSPN